MSTLYIVRHGQASFGSADYDRLSQNGERQAELLADHCAAQGLRFDHAYAGTLQRQIHTALPVLQHQADAPVLNQRKGFNEFNFRPVINAYQGYLERHFPEQARPMAELMQDKKAFQHFYDAAMGLWIDGELDDPEVEPWHIFKQRVIASLKELLADCSGHVLLSTSGGVIGVLMQAVLDLSDRQAINLSMQIYNSSVSKVFFDDKGRLALSSFNGLPHLTDVAHRSLFTYR